MNYDYIKQGDCLELMKTLNDGSVNIVLTSPPYNTGRNSGKMENHERRYDIYLEKRDESEYIEWTLELFKEFDRVLAKNGVVLYNMSYGNENQSQLWLTIASLIERSNFELADCIIWKKKSALPNNVSPNRLTRICEYVLVLCRKSESKTFNCNKKVKSYSKTGQKYYENVFNFIEAKNNDGPNALNKATFSSELVEKLIDMYSISNDDIILDPFMGTGTTAVGCINTNRHYIGFELSPAQVEYSINRAKEASLNRFEDTLMN
jgi:DNA modification methylase